MKKLMIIDGIEQYRNEVDVSFHMPGHKNKINILNNIGDNLYRYDITETKGTDDLFFPKSIIKNTLDYIKESYNVRKSYMVVNGTSCSVIASIMSCTNPGDCILVQRDCHKSAYSAIILGDLEVKYIYPNFNENYGLNCSINLENLELILKESPKIKAVLLTYPTFYGVCFNIKKAAQIVHKYNKVLIIDEAHGSHLNYSNSLPISAESSGADIVAQSTHKTLPAMTQCSVLHVCSDRINIDKLEKMLRLLQTSSPSYILMSSIHNAIEYMNTCGENRLEENINMFKHKVKEAKKLGITVLTKELVNKIGCYDFDESRVVVSLNNVGITGTELENILRQKYKVQVEMSDLMYIIGYITAADEPNNIEYLFNSIIEIYLKNKVKFSKNNKVIIKEFPELKQQITIKKAFYLDSELILLDESIGRLASDFIIPYPPGIPLVCPGEKIEKYVVDYIKIMLQSGINVNGIENNRLRVVK